MILVKQNQQWHFTEISSFYSNLWAALRDCVPETLSPFLQCVQPGSLRQWLYREKNDSRVRQGARDRCSGAGHT